MARTVTLLQLRERVRQRADMQTSLFVDDSELNGYINDSIAELYDLVRESNGEDYYTTSTPTVMYLTSSVSVYALPSDFLSLKTIQLQNGSNWINMERTNLKMIGLNTNYAGHYQYRLASSSIIFDPTPSSTGTQFRMHYVPASPVLTSDTDVWDGFNGWDDYVVVDAAIKCAIKGEDSIVSDLRIQKAALEARIRKMAPARDDANANSIIDVRGGWTAWGRGGGWSGR